MEYFQDKVCVVTGGGAGIGAELVKTLSGCGAVVAAVDIDPEPVEKLAAGLAADGGTVLALEANVCDPEQVQAVIDVVLEKHGRIDLFFNNAGVGLAGNLEDMDLADWKRVVDVNLWGVIHGVQAIYPIMLAQGSGQIVNIGSAAGLAPRPGMVPYATTKYAVVGLSTSLRAEAREKGVKVNAVCPFHVATDIFKNTVFKNLDGRSMMEAVPVKQLPVDECVEKILAGVRKDRAIIAMPFLAKFEWWLYRLCPPLVGALFLRSRRKLFQRFRISGNGETDANDET